MSKTQYGTVTVTVGDDIHTLTPTLGAVRAIEARFGGLRAAIVTVNELSIDGCAHIIAAGAGLTAADAEALPAAVWEAGISDVAPQLVPYVAALLNPRAAQASAEGNVPPAKKPAAR